MKIDEIMTLIQAVSESTLTSFELSEGDTKICLKREKEKSKIVTVAAPAVDPAVTAQMMSAAAGMAAPSVTAGAAQVSLGAQAAPSAEGKDAAAQNKTAEASGNVVTSPLVGTFYAAASPDAEPFVKEGDTVKKGQVLGIIEAMKLMNEIESEYDGVVEAVLVKDEDVVEYGQPLFRIR